MNVCWVDGLERRDNIQERRYPLLDNVIHTNIYICIYIERERRLTRIQRNDLVEKKESWTWRTRVGGREP